MDGIASSTVGGWLRRSAAAVDGSESGSSARVRGARQSALTVQVSARPWAKEMALATVSSPRTDSTGQGRASNADRRRINVLVECTTSLGTPVVPEV